MKKRITVMISILLGLMIISFYAFAHFNPHIKLIGTWTGDGTLDLLGDSPFDGAVELTFFMDQTGCVVTEQGETTFTYDVHDHGKWDVVTLDGGGGYNHGQQFYIDGKTLNIKRYEGIVIFTRQ